MELIKDFLNLLYDQVDRGIYVWGGNGEILDKMNDPVDWIDRREKSENDAKRAVALFHKRVAKGVSDIRAFDCSGLVYWVLKTMGLQKDDVSSRGLYNLCEKITEKDLRPGDLVFHHDGKQIVHVGVYAYDGMQIECKGRDDGVVQNKRRSGYWNRFGRWKGFKAESAQKYVYVKGGSVRIREGDNIKTRCIGIAHRGEKFQLICIAPSGWYQIKWSGLKVYITSNTRYTEVRNG